MTANITYTNARIEIAKNPDGTKSLAIFDIDSKTRHIVGPLNDEQCRQVAKDLTPQGIMLAGLGDVLPGLQH